VYGGVASPPPRQPGRLGPGLRHRARACQCTAAAALPGPAVPLGSESVVSPVTSHPQPSARPSATLTGLLRTARTKPRCKLGGDKRPRRNYRRAGCGRAELGGRRTCEGTLADERVQGSGQPTIHGRHPSCSRPRRRAGGRWHVSLSARLKRRGRLRQALSRLASIKWSHGGAG
jgi:hypothetical protein